MMRRWVIRVVVVALAALGLPLGGALLSPASAADQWLDGGFASSSVVNCASMIFGSPYTEPGVTTYTGYLGDLTSGTPKPTVGTVFYVHVVVGAPGNPCPDQLAWVDLVLPSGVSPAVSGLHPLYCLYDNVAQACPQAPISSPFHPGALSIVRNNPGTFGTQVWKVPSGHMWEFQLPVIATTQVNGTLQSLVKVLDGNDSPWLDARASMLVLNTSGGGGVPTINFTTPSTVITRGAVVGYRSTGTIITPTAGSVRFRFGTSTGYGEQDLVGTVAAGSWQAWDDWTPRTLTAGTRYHWTLCFTPNGGAENCGADQSFVAVAADGTPPTVISTTALVNPVTGAYASFRVTFSEPVTGFDTAALAESTPGLTGAGTPVISPGSGYSTTFTITAPVGLGMGSLSVYVYDNDLVKDASGNPLGGPGTGFAVNGRATVTVNHTTADVTPPTLVTRALPAVSLAAPATSWTASDGVGLASFRVSSRITSSAGVTSAFSPAVVYGPTVRSARLAVTAGTTRCVQVVAGDTSGNLTTAPLRCTVTPFDERRTSSSGKWVAVRAASAYAGTLSRASRAGAAKSLTHVTGHSIVVVAQKGPRAGVVQVLLNGKVRATWSLAAARALGRQVLVVPVRSGFRNATVTVRVKAPGSSGVLLDGLGVGA